MIDKDAEEEGPDQIEITNQSAVVEFQFETEEGCKEEDPLMADQKAAFNSSFLMNSTQGEMASTVFPSGISGLIHTLTYFKMSNVKVESREITRLTLQFFFLFGLCELDRQINYFYIGKLDKADEYLAAMGIVNFFTQLIPLTINFVSFKVLQLFTTSAYRFGLNNIISDFVGS